MRAFEIYLNGKRICTAGVGDDGVLSVIANHVIGHGRDEFSLHVGGLIKSDEHVTWRTSKLKNGDELLIQILESESVDQPKKRHLRDFAEEVTQEKDYVRRMAKKFGWQITSPPEVKLKSVPRITTRTRGTPKKN
jgi:hypothetical protein